MALLILDPMDAANLPYVGCDVLRRRDSRAPDVEHIHALLWSREGDLKQCFDALGRRMPSPPAPPDELRSLVPEGIVFLGHLKCIHLRTDLQADNPYGDQITAIEHLFWMADTAGQLYADLIGSIQEQIDQIGDLASSADITGVTLSLRENFNLSSWLDPSHALRRILDEISGYPFSSRVLSVHAATMRNKEATVPADQLSFSFWQPVVIGQESRLLRFAISSINPRRNIALPWRAGFLDDTTPSPHPACQWIGQATG